MMKKWLSMLLAAMMLICAGSIVCAAAETAESNSVDIVILLDMSNSMDGTSGAGRGNDPAGYRIDAAEMIVAMADSHSRVAVVPFAGTLIEADDRFVDLSSSDKRLAEMQKLEGLRTGKTKGQTDISNALCTGLNLLHQYGGTNRPMIILLTDGQTDFGINSVTKDFHVYDRQTELFVIRSSGQSTAKQAKAKSLALLREAVDLAVQRAVPIYTIGLGITSGEDARKAQDDNVPSLREISSRTGAGDTNYVNAANAFQLPDYFAGMFAAQIGSSLQKNLVPRSTGGNGYEVDIPVLNSSVLEANIYLSTQGVNRESISVLDGTGKERTDIRPLTGGDTSNFVLYKLVNPAPTGIWKMKFNADGDINDISFSLLYNYNISLSGKVGRNSADASADGYSAGKGAELYLAACFIDDAKGTESSDRDLYHDYSTVENAEDWYTIRTTWALKDSYGNTIGDGVLDTDGYSRFSTKIPLRELQTDANGFNLLSKGDYTVELRADGAGMTRVYTIPLELTNTPPEATTIDKSFKVDFSDDPATQGDQSEDIDLIATITDPDGDPLTYDLLGFEPQGVAGLKMTEGGTHLVISTVKNGSTYAHGNVQGTLRVTDPDIDSVDIPVNVDIISGLVEARNNWNFPVSFADGKQDTTAEKNSRVTVEMHLQDKNGVEDKTGELRNFQASLLVKETANTSKTVFPEAIVMEMDEDRNCLTASFDTTNKATDWTIETRITYLNETIDEQTLTLKVNNSAPELQNTDGLLTTLYYNPLPDFLSFLDRATPEENLTLTAENFFRDADNETGLTYEIVSDNTGLITADTADEKTWTLAPVEGGSGTANIILRATDGDGEVTEHTQTIEVIDILAKWIRIGLMALAALIALIILIAVVHQIRKPVFPIGTKLMICEGTSDYETETYEIATIKKPYLMSYCVTPDLAAKMQVSNDKLQNIQLKPNRRRDNSIDVTLLKAMGSSVTLDSAALTKKKTFVWPVGSTLMIEGEGSGALSIILNNDSNGGIESGDFGGENLSSFESTGVSQDDFNNYTGSSGFDSFGGQDADSFGAPASDADSFGASSDDDFSAGKSGSDDFDF